MIIAVGACMLMIAGEFDLSVGSMIGFAGMSIAILGVTLGWPVWIAILLTFALCIAIGALNGLIVVRTGLPSFIVTLAFLFILRGFTIFFPQLIERQTIIGGIDDAAEGDWLAPIFRRQDLRLRLPLAGRYRPDRRLLARQRAGEPVSTACRC
jgi:simple sugar transport system permease protein